MVLSTSTKATTVISTAEASAMTKKDFELIAGVFNDRRDFHETYSSPDKATAIVTAAYAMATALERYPKFNRAMFLESCGLKTSTDF